jgi:hypothetical protein
MTLVQQRQRRLRIDDGNNAIVTRTISIATMAKMLVNQRQQCHNNKGNNASLTASNKGDSACMHTHANEHIKCPCSHAPSQTYHMFELTSQLANLANLSSQASLQNLQTFAVGERMTNENRYAMTFGGDMVSKKALRV